MVIIGTTAINLSKNCNIDKKSNQPQEREFLIINSNCIQWANDVNVWQRESLFRCVLIDDWKEAKAIQKSRKITK